MAKDKRQDEYWIVEPDRAIVIQYVRRDAEWVMQAALGLDATILSRHFELTIPMRAIYRRVLA